VWLGRALNDSVRVSDSIGRVGGEEFMVVAPGTDADGAVVLAERLRVNVADGVTVYNGQPIRVTVSGGFAVVEAGTAIGYDQLREAAAEALREAKETGRNRCVIRTIDPTAA